MASEKDTSVVAKAYYVILFKRQFWADHNIIYRTTYKTHFEKFDEALRYLVDLKYEDYDMNKYCESGDYLEEKPHPLMIEYCEGIHPHLIKDWHTILNSGRYKTFYFRWNYYGSCNDITYKIDDEIEKYIPKKMIEPPKKYQKIVAKLLQCKFANVEKLEEISGVKLVTYETRTCWFSFTKTKRVVVPFLIAKSTIIEKLFKELEETK